MRSPVAEEQKSLEIIQEFISQLFGVSGGFVCLLSKAYVRISLYEAYLTPSHPRV